MKSKGEKERYSHFNAEFQRIARIYKKAFLSGQHKEIEENSRKGKTRDHFMKPEIKLPTPVGSSKKQDSSRKTSISAFLTMPKPLTVWITINCGKF